MSDTPRTDYAASLIQFAVVKEQYEVVTADFARDLERENVWMEDELMAIMQTVAHGMGGAPDDDFTHAIMVTGIRRMMEADMEKYEALLNRWQARQSENVPA